MNNRVTVLKTLTQYSVPRSILRSAIVAIGIGGFLQPAMAASFYVSTSGNDSNAGTISAPWRTSQKAGNSVTAGSTVYFRGGTYSHFDVNVSGSSSAGFITFTNYPGETAIIDGSGWTGSYDHGVVHIEDKSYIKLIGLEIRNGSSTSTSFGPCGVCVKGYGSSGSNIQVLNNNIHNITNTAGSNGNAHGILVRGESASTVLTNITVSGNQVYNCKTGWSESVTVAGNVDGFTIANNQIHDNNNIGVDCTGGYSGTANGAVSRNGTVSGNQVYNCSTLHNPYYNTYTCAGLYDDGGVNIVFERNSVHNCDYGVEVASEVPGVYDTGIIVRSNVIAWNSAYGIGVGGYNASGTGGTSNCTFVNNTLYSNDQLGWWIGEIHCGWRAYNNVFKNNVIYAGTSGVFLKDEGTDGANVGTFDYNEYYTTSGNANAKWQWINKTTWTYTFSSWQSLSGQDAHSFFSDPLFVNISGGNLDTASGSPARNTGTNLGSSVVGTLDFVGNTRVVGTIDRGAYEH